jgi:hypothetical protein
MIQVDCRQRPDVVPVVPRVVVVLVTPLAGAAWSCARTAGIERRERHPALLSNRIKTQP